MNNVPICNSCAWLQGRVMDHLATLELSIHLRTYAMNPSCYGCLRVWAVRVEADLLNVLAKLDCITDLVDARMFQSHLSFLGDILVDKRAVEERLSDNVEFMRRERLRISETK